jgi:hypothetical protein
LKEGKYGYGLHIQSDKRDGRFYVIRYLSRGHHKEEMKTVKKMIGGYDTLEEAEVAVADCIVGIKRNGDNWLPPRHKNDKRTSIRLMVQTKQMRMMRAHGFTFDQIAKMLGCSQTSVYNRTTNVKVNDLNEITGINERRGGYRARIRIEDQDIHVGDFNTLDDALAAQKKAILKHYR